MSKQGNMQSDTDINTVTVLRKNAPPKTTLKTTADISAAKRAGYDVATEKKFVAGSNKQHGMVKSATKLDQETGENLHHDTLGLDVARLIQQSRQAKEMTQKDLAAKVNEKPTVINEYESGKAIPNQQVMGKLERALGVRLRGKEKGQPLPQKSGKK